jgi:hypothetical protein
MIVEFTLFRDSSQTIRLNDEVGERAVPPGAALSL